MPPKIIRVIRNGEICEVEEDVPARAPRRSVGNGNGVESDADSDDDGPRSAEDLVAQRLFGASASSSSGPTFDFSKAPLAVAWEDRARSLAGLPGLAVFGAHLSSRWLVALAVSAAAFGLKGLFICFVVWVLFKLLGFEGETNRNSAGHQLGAHPHSGALPARALAAYLAAAGSGRAAAATAGNAPARGATAAGAAAATTTVGGSAGAASAAARKNDASEDVRVATRNAWAAREAAVAAAAKAAAAAAAEKESKE